MASPEHVAFVRHGGIGTSFRMGVAMFGSGEFAEFVFKMPVAYVWLLGGLGCAGLI